MGVHIREGELSCEDVQALLDFHFSAMRGNSPPDACHVLAAPSLIDAKIRFFSVRDEAGVLLGIGALKQLSPGHGELKSMRTAPGALGLGVGGALLAHLIAAAREQGMHRLSLETGGSADFAAALRLYEREGFTPCGPFGGYPGSPFTRFFTREI